MFTAVQTSHTTTPASQTMLSSGMHEANPCGCGGGAGFGAEGAGATAAVPVKEESTSMKASTCAGLVSVLTLVNVDTVLSADGRDRASRSVAEATDAIIFG